MERSSNRKGDKLESHCNTETSSVSIERCGWHKNEEFWPQGKFLFPSVWELPVFFTSSIIKNYCSARTDISTMNVFDVCEAAELVHAVFGFWDANKEQVVRFPAFAIYCVQPRSIKYDSHAFPCFGTVVSDTVYARPVRLLPCLICTVTQSSRTEDTLPSRLRHGLWTLGSAEPGSGPWCESTLT